MYYFICDPRDYNAFPEWLARSFGLATPGVAGRRIDNDFDAICRPGLSRSTVRQMSLRCYRGRPTRMVDARALLRCLNTTSAPPPPPSRHWHRHRHRHRPERAREAIAVQPALTFLCARCGNEFGVIVDRQPWWVRCSLFARGVVVEVAQFFFFFYTPPHRTRRHRRRACRKYNTNNNNIYYTLYYNTLCTHITRYRFSVMIILLQ